MDSSPNGSEKRVFSRIPCLVDLEVRGEESIESPETVEALDLSLLGVGFEAQNEQSLTPGDTVTVGMHGLRPVMGQVRWHSGKRVGVQFCGRFHDITESWVGEVLAAQGVRVQDLFLAPA
jgi:hypothetical protein